jgi:Domain of unknown function (DUF1707)
MDDSTAPALRASDADRERTAEALRRAAGEGRLSLEELDERLNATYAARTRAELEPLVADVVEADRRAAVRRVRYGAARAARAGSSRSWAAAIARDAGGSRRAARRSI